MELVKSLVVLALPIMIIAGVIGEIRNFRRLRRLAIDQPDVLEAAGLSQARTTFGYDLTAHKLAFSPRSKLPAPLRACANYWAASAVIGTLYVLALLWAIR